MDILRTTLIINESGIPISENILGQMEIKFDDVNHSGNRKYDPSKQRTIVSVNPRLNSSDKTLTKQSAAKFTKGWMVANIQWEESKVLDLVRTYCFSTASYKDGYRCNDNLTAYNSLMLDFDKHDKTLEILKNDFKNFQGTYCIFSSVNHTEEAPKLRVWIPLSRTITEKELELFKQKMIERYPTVDASCFALSRYWYFTPAKDFYFEHSKQFLDVDKFITEENRLSKPKQTKQNVIQGGIKSDSKPKKPIGEWKFSQDDEVVLSDRKTKVKIKDIKDKTRIFCPQCGLSPVRGNPDIDNAFIERTSTGIYFIHCTSESLTYWEDRQQLLPIKFIEKNNAYYKKERVSKEEYIDTMITSFKIIPKELLVLDNCDCLKCDIISMQGYTYKDILIENTDWHTKQKFLKAIGHQDCIFLGSENALQALCQFTQLQIPVRKIGTKVIGLHNDTWVSEGCNIKRTGKTRDLEIVPYDKGADAFYHKIKYKELTATEYHEMLNIFYDNILNVNETSKILAYLGWIYATPVKPIVESITGSFPLLFQHGSHGSGKTSLSKLFARLAGYTDPTPNSVTLKSFPMLKMLSSTNAIAQWYDEFKISDMKETDVDNVLRFMRKAYAGEVESKGRADQTIENYKLSAPMAVMGEWNINQPAIMERVVLVRTSDIIKSNKSMQDAFNKIKVLPLEGFMPLYIQYCLSQNIKDLLKTANEFISLHFNSVSVAPRIISNMAVMILGLELFRGFAQQNNLIVPEINYDELLDDQLEEITGSRNGMVRSAVDQLIEELSIMAEKGDITQYGNYRVVESKAGLKLLAVRFNKVFRDFKPYAKKTNYEGDLLDEYSYLKMFDSCSYIYDKSYAVKFEDKKTYKCLAIDIYKALASGINLDGFIGVNDQLVTSSYSALPNKGNQNSSLFD